MFQLSSLVLSLIMLSQSGASAQSLNGPIEFFSSPKQAAHQPIIDAIDQAQHSINMVMFHLSDPAVGSALMFAAKRGVNVRVIFDKGQWRSPKDTQLTEDMKTAGVNVVQASTGFRITHEKAMVIDDKKAMISTMNQIKTFLTMLDFGIFTYDQGVIAEFNKVFEVDWQNASTNSKDTPELDNPHLIWSPVNAADRLIALIKSSQTRVELMVENLGFDGIQEALISAAQRGVQVRVAVPFCDAVKPDFDYPFVQALRKGNVDARMLPGPASTALPYLHAKSIVVDQKNVFLGSENFSYSSLNLSREVGIIVSDDTLAGNVDAIFENLWTNVRLPPDSGGYKCSTFEVVQPGIESPDKPGAISTNWLNHLMIQATSH
jgi:phosphatidylserine/phosphatidylglycerophosphate/cardiolipin synthase-like enzyme